MSYKKRLPNLLTFSRIAVIPFMVGAFYLPAPASHALALFFFLYASVTDFFDGYLARKWHVESALGRFLDPVADKLLVTAALLYMVADARADVFPATIILLREALIAGLREHMMERGVIVHVTPLAKYKTAVQMTALLFLLAAPLWNVVLVPGQIALWVAAVLTAITGWDYARKGLTHGTNE